jgi:hypothetical protein
LPERREIKKVALSRPQDHNLPFSTWSLSKLAEFLVAEGVVDDISHEGFRVLLREEGVSFQVIKTWKQSTDPDFEAKKNRVLHLYGIADGKELPGEGDPTVVICMDEFGPLNPLPRPGKQWAPMAMKSESVKQDLPRRRRRRATFNRNDGVRHLMAAYDLNQDKMYGHIKVKKDRTRFLEFCRYLRTLYPPDIRIAIVMDNFSPHLSTRVDTRVGGWAEANNVELAYVPTNACVTRHRHGTTLPPRAWDHLVPHSCWPRMMLTDRCGGVNEWAFGGSDEGRPRVALAASEASVA